MHDSDIWLLVKKKILYVCLISGRIIYLFICLSIIYLKLVFENQRMTFFFFFWLYIFTCSIVIKKIRNLHNSLPLKTLLLIKKPQQQVLFSIHQNPSFFLSGSQYCWFSIPIVIKFFFFFLYLFFLGLSI